MAGSSFPLNRRHSLDTLIESSTSEYKNTAGTTENNQGPHTTSSLNARKETTANDSHRADYGRGHQQSNSHASVAKLTICQRYLSWRFFMIWLLQLSFVASVLTKISLPMAIVCMARPQAAPPSLNASNMTENVMYVKTGGSQNVLLKFANASLYNSSLQEKMSPYEFEWSSETQGLVLSSIMFSTFLSPILTTVVMEKIGSKLTLTAFYLVNTLLMLLTPVAARIDPYCLVALRILLGILVDSNTPAASEIVAWWAPHDEKLTMISLSFIGISIGGILGSVVSGYLCLVPLDYGWPFVFYTFGSYSFLWCVSWHFLSSQKPEEHPYISETEKEYIMSHRLGLNPSSEKRKVKIPYRQLLTSLPVYAYFAAAASNIWASELMNTYLPVYCYKMLQFSIPETGLLVSLTSVSRMLGSLMLSFIGNKLLLVVSLSKSRKICICSGHILAGVTAIAVGFLDHTYKWLAAGLLILHMLTQSVGVSTITVLPIDIAPRYAGILSGMGMSIGRFVAMSAPLLTAALTPGGTQEEWRTVWIITAGVYVAGCVIMLVFGNASIQPWAVNTDVQRYYSTFLKSPPLSPAIPGDKGNNCDLSTSQLESDLIFPAQEDTSRMDVGAPGNISKRDMLEIDSRDIGDNGADCESKPQEHNKGGSVL